MLKRFLRGAIRRTKRWLEEEPEEAAIRREISLPVAKRPVFKVIGSRPTSNPIMFGEWFKGLG